MEQTRDVDAQMTQAKKIYIFMVRVNKFSNILWCF